MPDPGAVTTTELWEQQRAELVGRRLTELRQRLPGSPLEHLVDRLYAELNARGLAFRPPVEIAERWVCHGDAPRIAVPFHLADPVLAGLDAEAAAAPEPVKLLRHQAGHAFASAYRLHERADWRERFGPPSRPRRERFHADPFSRAFVRHLPGWIAQKHPMEDFAETFAVWLSPSEDWREEYARWPALRKLEYVDRLAREIGAHPPRPVTAPREQAVVQGLHYAVEEPFRYCEATLPIRDERQFDADLRNIFAAPGLDPEAGRADAFIERHHGEMVERIAYWTGEATTVVRAFVEMLGVRAAALELRVGRRETDTLMELSAFVTTILMNYRYTDTLDGQLPEARG